MHLLFEKMQKILQITHKIYWVYAHSWWKTNPTIFPPNTSNTCQNSGNSLPMRRILEDKLKRLLKNLLHLNLFTLTKKNFSMKTNRSLTNMKVYNSRSKIIMLWHIWYIWVQLPNIMLRVLKNKINLKGT